MMGIVQKERHDATSEDCKLSRRGTSVSILTHCCDDIVTNVLRLTLCLGVRRGNKVRENRGLAAFPECRKNLWGALSS